MAKRLTSQDLDKLVKDGKIAKLTKEGKVPVNNWKVPPSLPFPEEKKRGRKPAPKGPKISTNDLTKNAIRYFRAKGFWAWRNNNVPVFDPEIGKFRRGSVLKGVSDIIGYHRTTGIALFVEIKNEHTKDKESPEQIAFLEAARKAGCHVFVIKSMNDLM